MDDTVYAIGGFGLQKDSEFLQIFNHFILKGLESGEFKRLHRNYYIKLYTRNNFEMIEPQPLGMNNVMFCFISLGFGICLSIIKVMMEFMGKKIFMNQVLAKSKDRGDGVTWATIRDERNGGEMERGGGRK